MPNMELRRKRDRQGWDPVESEEEVLSDSQDEVDLDAECSSDDDSRRGRSAISWKGSLEARFLKALQQAGGVWEAKPKAILQKMGAYASQLTTIQVKSHLQKHRIKVAAEMQRQAEANGGSLAGPGLPQPSPTAPLQQARQAAQLQAATAAAATAAAQQLKQRRRLPKQVGESQAQPKQQRPRLLVQQQRAPTATASAQHHPPSTAGPSTPQKLHFEHSVALPMRHSAPAILVDTASSGSGHQPSPVSGGSSSSGGHLEHHAAATTGSGHHAIAARYSGSSHYINSSSSMGGGMHLPPSHSMPQLHHPHPHHLHHHQLHYSGMILPPHAHPAQQQQLQYQPAPVHHQQYQQHYVHTPQQQVQQPHPHHHHHHHGTPPPHMVAPVAPPARYASFPPPGATHPAVTHTQLASQPSAPAAVWLSAAAGHPAAGAVASPSPGPELADGDGGWMDSLLGDPLPPQHAPLAQADPPLGPHGTAGMLQPEALLALSPYHPATVQVAVQQQHHGIRHVEVATVAAPPLSPTAYQPGSDSDSDHFHTDIGDLLDMPPLPAAMLHPKDEPFGGLCGLDAAAAPTTGRGGHMGGWALDSPAFF